MKDRGTASNRENVRIGFSAEQNIRLFAPVYFLAKVCEIVLVDALFDLLRVKVEYVE